MTINEAEPGDTDDLYCHPRHKQEGVYSSCLAVAVCPDDKRLLSVIAAKEFKEFPSAFVHLFLKRDEVKELMEALNKSYEKMED